MDMTTAQLYDLLVEKGFEKTRVREALSEISTKDEVEELAAAGFDWVRTEIRADMAQFETRMVSKLLTWIVGLSIANLLATVGVVISLFALLSGSS